MTWNATSENKLKTAVDWMVSSSITCRNRPGNICNIISKEVVLLWQCGYGSHFAEMHMNIDWRMIVGSKKMEHSFSKLTTVRGFSNATIAKAYKEYVILSKHQLHGKTPSIHSWYKNKPLETEKDGNHQTCL